MKIKHQLAIFNAITRLVLILVLWFMLPFLVQKVVYNNANKELIEKKQRFIKHLDKKEINDFIVRNDTTETYASFSTLHSEFLLLHRITNGHFDKKDIFTNVTRVIEEEENDYRILQYDFIYENIPYELEIGTSLSEIKELILNIRLFILIVSSIVVLFTFLLETAYIEYLLLPFYKIIDKKIRRVNEPDSFDYTPIISHSEDFKQLDTVLNEMMNRVSEFFKKEKQFIANVSHELLTPIALLKNKFENLLHNDSLDNNAVDKIASSLKTIDMLKKIINNLLLISRIENNQYQTNEIINLNEIFDDLLESLEDRIDEKMLTIDKEINNQIDFKGNKALIHVLLYNLLVNAIKYNSKKGTIKISDEFINQQYILSISDSGIGMNEEQVKQVFNRFTRVSSDQEGQGLGLAIVDSIAHFHHIKIEVKSKSLIGSTFLLWFPNNHKNS